MSLSEQKRPFIAPRSVGPSCQRREQTVQVIHAPSQPSEGGTSMSKQFDNATSRILLANSDREAGSKIRVLFAGSRAMSLQPKPLPPIPEQTQRIAKAAFKKNNLYLKMRDAFDAFLQDEHFADLFPVRGKPAESPWRLMLVTLFQFVENLSDRQAADAVRARIDWKYALSLELDDEGFDASLLCEFRARLIEQQAQSRLFEAMLARFSEQGLLKARGRQRTDSTYVLASVRVLCRVEIVGETLRHALNVLAEHGSAWLMQQAEPDWFDRYSLRIAIARLPKDKKVI
jgi:transposase